MNKICDEETCKLHICSDYNRIGIDNTIYNSEMTTKARGAIMVTHSSNLWATLILIISPFVRELVKFLSLLLVKLRTAKLFGIRFVCFNNGFIVSLSVCCMCSAYYVQYTHLKCC